MLAGLVGTTVDFAQQSSWAGADAGKVPMLASAIGAPGVLPLLLDEDRRRQHRQTTLRETGEVLACLVQLVAKEIDALLSSGKLRLVVKDGLLVIQMQSDVLFDAGKSNLKPAARPVLRDLARVLKGFTGRRFQVAGHTDPSGGPAINWPLSTARALSTLKPSFFSALRVLKSPFYPQSPGRSAPFNFHLFSSALRFLKSLFSP